MPEGGYAWDVYISSNINSTIAATTTVETNIDTCMIMSPTATPSTICHVSLTSLIIIVCPDLVVMGAVGARGGVCLGLVCTQH